jgi:ribosome-associated protein
MTPTPTDIPISGETIRLGQLLKLAGLVEHGGEAKRLLADSPAVVNGVPEARRGRQLHAGDTVRFGDAEVRVVQATPPAAGP